MAFTAAQLAAAEATYARMALSVRHGDKSITLAALEEQWTAIQRMRASLTTPRPPTYVRLTTAGY